MGHFFCRSRWKTQADGQWSSLRHTPCFAEIKGIYGAVDRIHTQVIPTTVEKNYGESFYVGYPKQEFPIKLTSDQVEVYIKDVMEAMPGVATRVGQYEFEYNLRSSSNYFKFLATAALLRALEEFWMWVEDYFDMRAAGIPRDIAFVAMSTGGRKGIPSCGHWIAHSLGKTRCLKDYSFERSFFASVDQAVVGEHGAVLWDLFQQPPWFGKYSDELRAPTDYPYTFKLTKEVYDALADPKCSVIDRQAVITKSQTGKTYTAIAA